MKREVDMGIAPAFTLGLIGGLLFAAALALSGCAYTRPYTDAVTSSTAYKATAEFVAKHHEGTPCSAFRYGDTGCD